MKHKKIMLVAFLLLVVLTIGAVSASDDTDFNETLTVDNVEEVSLDTSIDEEVSIDASVDDEIISESGDDVAASSDSEAISNWTYSYSISVADIHEGEDAIIENYVSGDSGGNATIHVSMYQYECEIVDGYGSLTISGLRAGDYVVWGEYHGGVDATANTTFRVWPNGNSSGDVELWVNTDDTFPTAQEHLGDIFATVTVPEGTGGNVIFSIDDNILYNKSLSDFDPGRIEGNKYAIALGENGKFIFEDCQNEDVFKFAFFDENGDEIASSEYVILFEDDTVRFDAAGEDGEMVFINPEEIITNPDNDNYNPNAVVAFYKDTSIRQIVIASNDGEKVLFNRTITEQDFDEGIYEIYIKDLNLANVADKDILNFIYFDGNGNEIEDYPREYLIKVRDDFIQLFEFEELDHIEFYSFYGNLTTGDLNDPELMGWHPHGNFTEVINPVEIDEITLTINGGGFSKTYTIDDMIDRFNPDGNYIYQIGGYSYTIKLNDTIVSSLPENEILTFNYLCGDWNVTQKRIRQGDYVYKIITPDDIATLFIVNVTDDELNDINDVAATFNATFYANIQSIAIEVGAGYFNVYVNGTSKRIVYLGDYCHDGAERFLALTLADLDITSDGTYNIKVIHFPSDAAEYQYVNETEVINKNIFFNSHGDENKTTDVNIDVADVEYGNDVIIIVHLESDATGTVAIEVNGFKYAGIVVNGEARFTLSGLNVGTYTVTANYSGDNKYLPASNTTVFTVTDPSKIDPNIAVLIDSVYYPNDLVVRVVAPGDATGSVVIEILNKNYTATLVGGEASASISGLNAGSYEVVVYYAGDDKYNGCSILNYGTVLKANSTISIVSDLHFDYGQTANITVVFTGADSFTASVDDDKAVVSVNGSVVTVSGLDAGSYTLTVATVPDGNHNSVNATAEITVNKVDMNVHVDNIVFTYGDKGTSHVTVNGGNIDSIYVDGHSEAVINSENNVITVSNLSVGSYILVVTTIPDGNHNAVEATANITVLALPKTVTNDTFSKYFDENGVYIADLEEIIFVGDFTDIPNVEINIPLIVDGQDAVFTNTLFNIHADDVIVRNLKINCDLDDYAVTVSGFNITFANNYFNATRSMWISLSENFTVESNYIVNPLAENVCGIHINGTGSGVVRNNKLDLKSTKTVYAINTHPTGPLKVKYLDNNIDAESYFAVGIYDDSELIKGNVISLSGNYTIGIVVLSNANVTDNNVTTSASNKGNEDVEDPIGIETAGIKVNNDATITGNNIESTNKSISVIGGSSTISDNIMKGKVTVESNGNVISNNLISTDDGYAVDLGDSTGNVVDSNEMYSPEGNGNDAVNPGEGNDVINNFEKFDPAMTISASDIVEGADAVITIKTNATFSGSVDVQIGTSKYTVNVVNGAGTLTVPGLGVGTYTAVATFNATDVFNATSKNTTFTVKAKTATSIKASAITTTYGTSKNIVVTLTDANNNPVAGKTVTVVLNGVSKTLNTNNKGQATLAIGTSLAPKTYTATITFAGDANYVKSTGSVKVVVNKAKSILAAKKKTFKVKKAKKYTIVLKTDKKKALKKVKVTITLKAKGKKIKITKKTNAKGKAIFNLKKLTKKGKYTATVKFAGNSYYKAVTKKVKITVK